MLELCSISRGKYETAEKKWFIYETLIYSLVRLSHGRLDTVVMLHCYLCHNRRASLLRRNGQFSSAEVNTSKIAALSKTMVEFDS